MNVAYAGQCQSYGYNPYRPNAQPFGMASPAQAAGYNAGFAAGQMAALNGPGMMGSQFGSMMMLQCGMMINMLQMMQEMMMASRAYPNFQMPPCGQYPPPGYGAPPFARSGQPAYTQPPQWYPRPHGNLREDRANRWFDWRRGETVSTASLRPNQAQQGSAQIGGRSTNLTAARNGDGSSQVTTDVHNGNASLQVQTQVGNGGRIDSNVQTQGDQIISTEVAQNSNASAVTVTQTVQTPTGTNVNIQDMDGYPNSTVTVANNGQVTVVNPGNRPGDNVVTQVSTPNHGLAERIGESGDNMFRWVTGQPRGDDAVTVSNASNVNVQRNQDGSQTTIITNGQGGQTTHNRGADGVLQQTGQFVDNNVITPVVNNVITPVVDNVVAPVVNNVIAPVVNNVVAPVVNTVIVRPVAAAVEYVAPVVNTVVVRPVVTVGRFINRHMPWNW